MNTNEFDFETEFMSDEEVEAMLAALDETVGVEIEKEDSKTAIINPYKVQQVLYTYKLLKYLTKGTNAKITYALHEPFKSTGFVSIVGTNLSFKHAEWFTKAVELSSNFDVYPKSDGTVQMDFTFHGLTRPIE